MHDCLFLGILLIFLLLLSRAGLWVGDSIGDSSGIISTGTFIYLVPLSAGAMIACIFFGVTVSLIFSILVTLFAGMIFGKEFAMFFYFMIGAFVAAHECDARSAAADPHVDIGLCRNQRLDDVGIALFSCKQQGRPTVMVLRIDIGLRGDERLYRFHGPRDDERRVLHSRHPDH